VVCGTAYRYTKDCVSHARAVTQSGSPLTSYTSVRFRGATHHADFDNRISVWIPGDIETNEASGFPHMQIIPGML
jgi:hypothetical protein